jgi:hypothetical protein
VFVFRRYIFIRVARWFIFGPKLQFGKILGGVGRDNVSIFYDHWEYFTATWYHTFMAIWFSLWPFGIFSNLLCLDLEKSGNPDIDTSFTSGFLPNLTACPKVQVTNNGYYERLNRVEYNKSISLCNFGASFQCRLPKCHPPKCRLPN